MSTTFRVTQHSPGARALDGLQAQLSALGRIQEQLSSGRLISKPSDSPTGTAVALQTRAQIRASEQYGRNATDGLCWLSTADTTLSSVTHSLRRVRDLTVQGMSTGTPSAPAREALAAGVKSLRDGLVQLANTQYNGRPVFGGTTAQAVAYNADGSFAGNVAAVNRTVGDNTVVQVAMPGPSVFGDDATGAFAVLGRIYDHLTNDPGALQTDLTNLDTAIQSVISSRSTLGAYYSRVESMKNTADNRVMDLEVAQSEVENVDLPKTIMELQMQQTAYQAALGATGRVITPSLVDFLR